jgi:hypothetical protein
MVGDCGSNAGGKEVRVMRTKDSEDCVRPFSFENRTLRDRWGWNVANKVDTTLRWWGGGGQCRRNMDN